MTMEMVILNYELSAWQFFAAVGLIFIFLEVFVPGFVMLPIGLASLLTSPVCLFAEEATTQFFIFGLNLLFVFVVLFKFLRPKLKSQKKIKTNVETMAGSIAEVTESFEGDQFGYVKLYGDRWQAYSTSNEKFEMGEKVQIVNLKGNKVEISKIKKNER